MSRLPTPAELKRACDTILAVRCILTTAAAGQDADEPLEPIAMRWLSDQLSAAVEQLESPDTAKEGG